MTLPEEQKLSIIEFVPVSQITKLGELK